MKVMKIPEIKGRPRAFNIEKALDQAMIVFWQKGYEGASLSDLTEAMGINRPSLYAAFGNKEALFRKALDRYRDGPSAYFTEALNLPTGTSGAPTAPPPPQRDVALNALNAGAERTSPSPVSNVPDNTPAEPRPDAVAAVALAPPPKPERAAAPSPSAEYVAVLDVLNKYAAAYSRLDAAAAQEVWPAVNRPALAHAFDGLASQHVALERCDVSLSTESAHANCNGFATWSPKIGNSAAHTDACNWTFQLAKAGTDWQIVSARVQKR